MQTPKIKNKRHHPHKNITGLIYLIRGKKVIIDRGLAALYGVGTKRLKEQVKSNIEKFPEDIIFELSKSEFTNWRSQFATSNREKIKIGYLKKEQAKFMNKR
jgi:hypothetical protein